MAEKKDGEKRTSLDVSPPAHLGESTLSWRQQVALTILAAHVRHQGGLGGEHERVPICRVLWQYADAFLEAEKAPPPQPLPAPTPAPAQPRGRPDHPSDEWGVRDGDRLKRGFMTRGEAEYYATARTGAVVVQLAGPEIEAQRLTGGGDYPTLTSTEDAQARGSVR